MNELKSRIQELLNKYKEPKFSEEQIQALQQISEELKSEKAIESIKQDPYWPKWDSPWWKVVLLYEAGYKHLIPREFLVQLINVIDKHYLHFFPLAESDIPKECDPYRHILCFCALGNMYKVLEGCGFDVKSELPWWYDWILNYQLPDGGYNCDEGAYTGSRKSSFQSTLPMLEAMLLVYQRTGDSHIKSLLDRGADYLIKHEVYKSSSGRLIEEEWLQLSFPHYYDYDVLRGFSFLVKWAFETKNRLPEAIVIDCLKRISASLNSDGCVVLGLNKICRDRNLSLQNGNWKWSENAELFPVLELFSREGDVSIPLSIKWYQILMYLMEW
ncbi:MAG: hypothetical protein JXR56_07540 [Candidatus Cloacimonetes bacterium]|nr:hypothetical protein [Candidatus Cloacimonadota bacterium]